MSLNQLQIKQLRSSLGAIVADKLEQLRTQFLPLPKELSLEDRYELVKSGTAKLIPLNKITTYTDFVCAFTFPGDGNGDKVHRRNQDFLNENRRRLEAEQRRIMDEAILGDVKEALAMIKSFAAMKVIGKP